MFDIKRTYVSGDSFFQIELENYYIDYIPGRLNQLVITFENADQPDQPRLDRLRAPWGASFLTSRGYSVVGVKPKRVDWYRGVELHHFFKSQNFQIFISSFTGIILYGSSMGGFGALTFASVCPDSIVIALNPQSTLDVRLVPWEKRYPEGRAQDWTGDFADARHGAAAARLVFLAYDPLFDLDRWHINRLSEGNIISLKMPLVGHVVGNWMREAGILTSFVEEALTGSLTEHRCRQLARMRRNVVHYYYGMGMRTRFRRVAHACAVEMIGRSLTHQDQREFIALLKKWSLWNCIGGEKFKPSLINFEINMLLQILKSSMSEGLHGDVFGICESYILKRGLEWQILVLAAESLHYRGLFEPALEYAIRAVQNYPAVGNCYRVLARIQFDMHQLPQAVATAEAGALRDQTSVLGLLDLARYYEASGLFQQALNSALKAASVSPRDLRASAAVQRISMRLRESSL